VSAGDAVEVLLAPESIEELALRLAEALQPGADSEGGRVRGDPKMISAAEVSERWGVARRWVYNHAEGLGARRLGAGRRPRLRFDPAEVAERLGAPRPAGVQSDGRRLTAMRANPHSDSLSGRSRAMFGGQGNR
jgi:hypothetical protein